MNSALDLKPCPFCGGTAALTDDSFEMDEGDVLSFFVTCTKGCEFQMPSRERQSAAAEDWNRRPPESGTGTPPREVAEGKDQGLTAPPLPEKPTDEDLRKLWYAPGHYMITCLTCKKVVIDCDKRAARCRDCAVELYYDRILSQSGRPLAEPSNPNPIPQVSAPLPVEPATAPRPDLEAIEARANATTPGEWHTDHDDKWVAGPLIDGDWDWICGPIDPDGGDTDDEDLRGQRIQANCRFIAAARQDIPALIAYIRKLESAPGAGIDKGEGT